MSKRNSETAFLDAKIRFWSKTKTGEPNQCWECHSSNDDFGYGRITIAGNKVRTHRFSYAVHHNLTLQDLKGVVIRHTCDNPACVNPNHLLPGTQADNNRDTVERGRKPVGAAAHKSKLTEKQVLEIRELHGSHSMNLMQLGKAYNVTFQTISEIVNRKTWKNL